MKFNDPVDVTNVSFVHGTVVDLEFDDGARKRVDLRPLMQGPIFAELFETNSFGEAVASPEEGTLVWPNGASLDASVLRHLAAGQVVIPDAQYARAFKLIERSSNRMKGANAATKRRTRKGAEIFEHEHGVTIGTVRKSHPIGELTAVGHLVIFGDDGSWTVTDTGGAAQEHKLSIKSKAAAGRLL